MPEQTAIPLTAQIEMCQQIAHLARADAAWAAAWRRLEGDQRDPLAKVVERIELGQPLADALAPDRSPTSNMLRASIIVGETLGNLPQTLQLWTELITQRSQVKRTLWTSSLYPALLVVLSWVSLGVVLHSTAPVIHEFYQLWLDSPPTWTTWLDFAYEHQPITLSVAALLMVLPIAWWVRSNCGTARSGLPRDRSELYRRRRLACELMADMVSAGRPLLEVVKTGVIAAGGSEKQSDAAAKQVQQQAIVPLLGKEASVALLALRANLITGDKAEEHLRQLARQLATRSELAAARRARWLPRALAIIAGTTIAISYLLLVYLPWTLMLRDCIQPNVLGGL